MSGHTPGPWRLEGRSVITDGFQHSDRNSEICTVSGSREFGTEHGENELFHNAQLIAAAPELAAALLEAESWMIEYGIGSNKVLYSIGAALAKAGLKKAGL